VPPGAGGLNEPFAIFVAISTLKVMIVLDAWQVRIPAAPSNTPDNRAYLIDFRIIFLFLVALGELLRRKTNPLTARTPGIADQPPGAAPLNRIVFAVFHRFF
jgi:hypothetical protein